jgi:VanZ family protein
MGFTHKLPPDSNLKRKASLLLLLSTRKDMDSCAARKSRRDTKGPSPNQRFRLLVAVMGTFLTTIVVFGWIVQPASPK